jgi:hypothetical protein
MSKPEKEPVHADRAEPYGRILDLTEAGLWIVLLVVGSLVALAVLRDSETRHRPSPNAKPAPGGLIEAEDLPVIAKSREFTFWLQPSSGFTGGYWSKDGHMFAHGTQLGDWVELRLPEQEPGRYSLEFFMTKAADYGVVAVFLNEARLGAFDLWSGRGVVPSGALKLGDVELVGRKNVLRLAIEGKNPNATPPFFQFGIDGIRIRKSASVSGGDGEADAIPEASKSDADRASAEAE